MGWPFEIINLSPEEKRMRRQVLDLYATYAHFSTLVPVLLFLLYRLSVWARRAAADSHGGAYGAVPTSPTLKVKRQTALGTWATWFRKLRWWLGDDVYVFGRLFCQRDQLVFGCLWFSWLLVLSVVDTHRGKDSLPQHSHPFYSFHAEKTSKFCVVVVFELFTLSV